MPPRPYVHSAFVAVLTVLFLAAGGVWGPQPVAGQPPETKPARRFLVEPGSSAITVGLFKEGLFSGFAHDHVLVGNGLSGEIVLAGGDTLHATARFSLSVESFQVDLPEHRKREQLAGAPSDEERREIRETMLGPDQLHAAKHPRITAVLERIEGSWPLVTAITLIRIRDGEKRISIPLNAELNGNMLRATGSFEARHSDFAIEPFSSFMGMVAVQDQFRVRFRIEAREIR